MKETILDVLLFLFENYFYDDPDAVRDRDSLQHGLIQAGFSPTEISKAFDWLEELANQYALYQLGFLYNHQTDPDAGFLREMTVRSNFVK